MTKPEILVLMKTVGDAGSEAVEARDNAEVSTSDCLKLEIRFEGMLSLAYSLLPDLFSWVPEALASKSLNYETAYECVKFSWEDAIEG